MTLSDDQVKFIQQQAKTQFGERWLDVFRTLVNELYTSRGKDVSRIVADMTTADFIEKQLVRRMEVAGDQPDKERKGEYE